jgi:hypothetical protein
MFKYTFVYLVQFLLAIYDCEQEKEQNYEMILFSGVA